MTFALLTLTGAALLSGSSLALFHLFPGDPNADLDRARRKLRG